MVGNPTWRSAGPAVALVMMVMGTGWALAGCTKPAASGPPAPSGQAVLGSAPVVAATSPSTEPSPSASPSESPAPLGQLKATYEIKSRLLVKHEIIVTITNEGSTTGSWAELVIVLSGLDLVVGTAAPIQHEANGRTHIFRPNDEVATLAPGDTLGFNIAITGSKPNVTSCTLDGQDCVKV